MMKSMLMTYLANRKITYDILEALTEEELTRKWDRPGLDTFSKHFQEMAVVTDAYADALESGNMDFSKVPDVFDFENISNKEELKDLLQKSDSRLENIVNLGKYKEGVFWFDMTISPEIHFTNIISHEIFHQGMMTMFMYQNRIAMPGSLIENWSLPGAE